MKVSVNGAASRPDGHQNRLKMKMLRTIAILSILVWAGVFPQRSFAGEEEGVAVAIVYDTSGSMKETVSDKSAKAAPKYIIANRALIAIAQQIQAFTTNSAGAQRKIEAGLFIFNGDNAREAVKFGPFDAKAIEEWAKGFSTPSGSTPLGNALNLAGRAVLQSPLPRKHVLVLTDGINTAGPQPATILPRLKQQAEQGQTSLSVHFVAFDVAAKVFDPVKKLGATVVGAADEKQLNTQLEFILQRKILLEDEEPRTITHKTYVQSDQKNIHLDGPHGGESHRNRRHQPGGGRARHSRFQGES